MGYGGGRVPFRLFVGYCYGNSLWTNGLAGYAAFGTSMTS